MIAPFVSGAAAPTVVWGEPKPKVEFNVRPEDLPQRQTEAKKKKVVVPSFTRNIKTMREICQAISMDGRLDDFQKVVGAQPNFSLDCPTCRPFFRIWFSSCQIKGVGNLKFSPPEEPTPTPAAAPSPGVGEGAGAAQETPAGDGAAPSVEPSPTVEAQAPSPSVAPTAGAGSGEAPAADEGGDGGASEEDGVEEEDGEAKPTPTPTPRPIGPERDPNIVVLDLISRLFDSLAQVEGAELSLMAVDMLVGELRNPTGKSEATLAYFDTLAEYMLAPFESVRERVSESPPVSGESGVGETVSDEAVNAMFE